MAVSFIRVCLFGSSAPLLQGYLRDIVLRFNFVLQYQNFAFSLDSLEVYYQFVPFHVYSRIVAFVVPCSTSAFSYLSCIVHIPDFCYLWLVENQKIGEAAFERLSLYFPNNPKLFPIARCISSHFLSRRNNLSYCRVGLPIGFTTFAQLLVDLDLSGKYRIIV